MSYMNVKTFVETNVLIYAYDADAGRSARSPGRFCGNYMDAADWQHADAKGVLRKRDQKDRSALAEIRCPGRGGQLYTV
jgi:hypothetical protein